VIVKKPAISEKEKKEREREMKEERKKGIK